MAAGERQRWGSVMISLLVPQQPLLPSGYYLLLQPCFREPDRVSEIHWIWSWIRPLDQTLAILQTP